MPLIGAIYPVLNEDASSMWQVMIASVEINVRDSATTRHSTPSQEGQKGSNRTSLTGQRTWPSRTTNEWRERKQQRSFQSCNRTFSVIPI
jgi:hypothetical protein